MRAVFLALALLGLAVPALAQTNASVSRNTVAAPTSSTQIGSVDGFGNLQAASSANPLPVTVTGTTSVTTTHAQSAALAANLVVKASAGNLYSFEVSADSTLSGAAWWLILYDATAAPADGAITPAKCYAMASGVTAFTGAFPNPVAFTSGIVIGVSTTGCFTKTASTHAFIAGDYK